MQNEPQCAQVEKPEPEVPFWLDRLDARIAETSKVASMLQDRLVSVSRVPGPQPPKPGTSIGELVPVANRLRNAEEELGNINSAITQMIELLEI